jgi:CheY-like chemotaxis protein/HPt (histidine-containing phosphotransfer) domain-containing protein
MFEKQPPGLIAAPMPLADLTGARILVVDDREINRLLVTTLLKNWGCSFAEAANGETALDRLREAVRAGRPYEAALVDRHMPGLDGPELGRRIKQSPELRATQLILMTSLGERGDATQFTKIGFAGYLTKPLRQALLRECLALVLGRSQTPAAAPAPGLITRHTVSEARKQRVRILLAEDNITNQLVVKAMLKKLGYRADVVANGREVLTALQIIPYDLVLMDCQMPEMDGFAATRAIRKADLSAVSSAVLSRRSPLAKADLSRRSLPKADSSFILHPSSFPHIPIIALTALVMPGDREKCLEAGMNDFLGKPVQPAELAAVLERWLDKVEDRTPKPFTGKKTTSNEAPAEKHGDKIKIPSVELQTACIFDKAAFLARIMHDKNMARIVIKGFLDDMPQQIEALKKYCAAADVANAERQAHNIKGAAAIVSGEALRRTAFAMEKAGKAGDVKAMRTILPETEKHFEQLKAVMDREDFNGEDG